MSAGRKSAFDMAVACALPSQILAHTSSTFDGSRFASGIYFYRLVTGNYTATKKLVLIK